MWFWKCHCQSSWPFFSVCVFSGNTKSLEDTVKPTNGISEINFKCISFVCMWFLILPEGGECALCLYEKHTGSSHALMHFLERLCFLTVWDIYSKWCTLLNKCISADWDIVKKGPTKVGRVYSPNPLTSHTSTSDDGKLLKMFWWVF